MCTTKYTSSNWHPAGLHTTDYTPSKTCSSDSCQSPSLYTNLVHTSWVYWCGCYRRQCWKSCASQDHKYQLSFSHPLSLSFHCRRLWGSQAWFPPSQIRADYSFSPCSYKVWKWLPRLCAPTPSQGPRWADQPTVPQILLVLLDIGFLPVLRNLSWSPGSSKEN